ncbi:MAG TPA: helix-turn-helix domain-containing protein, partial [Rhodocyclaceae bacterium]|nr:helix-turn-helix domain-containing protein [Rhodocyclaceae bacterium]
NVRVIAATNRDLEAEVRAGRFRQDLYYRLATMTLTIPALRERPMDLPLLAEKLLAAAQLQLGKTLDGFTREALACIASYRWPGNVRDLRNEIVRALALCEGRQIGAELLSPRVLRSPIGQVDDGQEEELSLLVGTEGTLKERLDQLETRVIKETLIRHRWNKSKAAQELGLSRVGLRMKLTRYGLEKQ